jgi:hypothetical protein
MGHSFVEFEDRGVWLNDALLTLIRHFIEREGRRLLDESGAPAGLRRSFEQFLEGFTDYGPGVFVVDFCPMLAGGEGQFEFLLSVFDRTAQALRGFGGTIPRPYLDQYVNTPAVFFTGDVDTGPVLGALRRIWGLFSGFERGQI